MTLDDIISMAREADLLVTTPIPDDSVFVADLARFAALVAAAEREACARLCDRVGYDHEVEQGAVLAFDLAIAIRARGEK